MITLTVLILRGISGSGKSTYARNLITAQGAKKKGDLGFKRWNHDEQRVMIDNSQWSKDNEKFIDSLRDDFIIQCLNNEWSVVIDNTNLHERHLIKINDIVNLWNTARALHGTDIQAIVEEKWFHISPEEAIKRDQLPDRTSVGAGVIWQQYNRFIKGKIESPSYEEASIDLMLREPDNKVLYNPDLPDCIIVDIDGTLSHKSTTRGIYDFHKADEDTFDEIIADIVKAERDKGTAVIVCSGRDEEYRAITTKWLEANDFSFTHFFLRGLDAEGKADRRKDTIIKREIYEREIKNKYNVKFILDDRSSVVIMWRSLGLKCLQVNYGNF